MQIEVLNHASVKLIDSNKIIYFDPFEIKQKLHDADYIFITHDHYDHYDLSSINNIVKDTTKIIVPKCLKDTNNYLVVEPNKYYEVDNLKFNTIPSYNLGKEFHPKEKDYVGYNVFIKGFYYYIMGDTDITEEAKNVKTDVCFVPIGGTYTMNVDEAAEYINLTRPKKVIPIHYGSITGSKSLANEFKTKIDEEIEVEIKI